MISKVATAAMAGVMFSRMPVANSIEKLRNFKDEPSGKNWYELTSQAFTVFLSVKSVGVLGDGRTYDCIVALRAAQTSDIMTADWAELPCALLKKFSGRIINEVAASLASRMKRAANRRRLSGSGQKSILQTYCNGEAIDSNTPFGSRNCAHVCPHGIFAGFVIAVAPADTAFSKAA
jgi:hypothetical protein